MYEIPQQLRYEERVLFGLTIKQFVFVAIFGFLAAMLFFRTDLFFEARVAGTVFLGFIGLGFAFFDFDEHLKNAFLFWQSPRKSGFMDKKARDFVEVRDVASDLLVMKDGSVRAIIQVTPINFGIKSDQEKEAIIENYQAFLNSLTFPIQILMRTVNLDLNDYMDAFQQHVQKVVEKTGQTQMIELFQDYRTFMNEFIKENAIQDRLFYIIIPLRPAEAASREKEQRWNEMLREMESRTELVRSKLGSVGLQSKRLNTDQLTSLLSSFFEGFIEVENDYLSPITLLQKYAKIGKKTRSAETEERPALNERRKTRRVKKRG